SNTEESRLMKKLIVCCTVCVLLVVVAIARYQTGSAELSAAESARLASHALLALVAEQGVPVPENGVLDAALGRFFEPGAYLLTRLGVLPEGPAALAVAFLASWWIWLAGLRTVWSILSRASGGGTIGDWHWWLWITAHWRPVYRAWSVVARWYKQFRFGKQATASWTGILAAMTMVYKPGDSVFLGRLWVHGIGLWQPIGIRGPRHITVVAGSGAGKTRWLMGWLGMLHKKASAFIIDCDGQMVNALGAALERAGHRVLCLDPYRLSSFPGACWNALDEISAAAKRHGKRAAVRFSHTLASALLRDDNSHQPVFAQTARGFVHGL